MVSLKEREVVDENSTFQSSWTEEYFLFVLEELLISSFIMKLSLF